MAETMNDCEIQSINLQTSSTCIGDGGVIAGIGNLHPNSAAGSD